MEPPDTNVALAPIERPRAVDIASLPTYFTRLARERDAERSQARKAAGAHALNAFLSAVATVMGAMVFSAGCAAGSWLPVLVGTLTVMFAPSAFIVETWRCGERLSFLHGTRDDAGRLPSGCREFAAQEAALHAAVRRMNEDVARWDEAADLVVEHGDDRHRRLAEGARRRLEARRAAIIDESGRLWSAAAASEAPHPRDALAGPDARKALPPREKP